MGHRLASLGCSALLVLVAATTPLGTAGAVWTGDLSSGGTDGAVSQQTVPQQSPGNATEDGATPPIDADSVILHADVLANGTAEWRIEYRTRLDDPATASAFAALQRDLRSGSGTVNQGFYDRIRASVAAAENATGRPMNATGFAVSTNVRRLPQEYGVVVYQFSWHGFATVGDDRITAGDALAGFFLNEDEQFLVSWPDGYELDAVRPPPDERRADTVVWTGPATFEPDQPRVVAVAAGPLPSLTRFGAAVALIVVAAALVWLRHRSDRGLPRPTALFADDGDDGRELLSNEEQVVTLLEERGGRVKQQEVAEELGWTKTKTSYVVSKLRDEGRIHSFRLGRENVLSLSEPNESGGGD